MSEPRGREIRSHTAIQPTAHREVTVSVEETPQRLWRNFYRRVFLFLRS